MVNALMLSAALFAGQAAGQEQEQNLLMSLIEAGCPSVFNAMDESNIKLFGWLQQGFTGNPDSPANRRNFGVNFNNRANDYQLNQFYLVLERQVQGDEFNIGFRIDSLTGTDSSGLSSNGWFDHVVPTSRRGDRIGYAMPQFYLDFHIPGVFEGGSELRVGNFYTLHVNEQSTGTNTDFYSHTYAWNYSPFTHFGALLINHLTDTVSLQNGIVRGWDQTWDDNNGSVTWHGMLNYAATDKSQAAWVSWTWGPERDNDSKHYRALFTADVNQKFGPDNKFWLWLESLMGYEAAAEAFTGRDATWYGAHCKLLYNASEKVILGTRLEWFADPYDVRIANGLGGDDYFAWTAGITFRPWEKLRIRPEFRYDWAGRTRPYNDDTKRNQTTLAVDCIWDF